MKQRNKEKNGNQPHFHLRSRSVQVRVWQYFCLFTVMLLVIIWALQYTFTNVFYSGRMELQALSASRKVVREYESTMQLSSLTGSSAYKNSMMIVVTDERDNIIATTFLGQVVGFQGMQLSQYSTDMASLKERFTKLELKEAYAKVAEGENNYMLIYISAVEDGTHTYYVYVMNQLEPNNLMMNVLYGQFFTITVISLVLALFMSFLIALRLAMPLKRLTASAKKLAKGDYSTQFQASGYAEIEELAQALNYATQELGKTNALRRELIANVSHDLRTPLTMIKMYAEMIRDISGNNPEKREQNLQIIIDETDRLSLLVNDFLDMSKIESGASEIEPIVFNLSNTICEIVRRFSVLEEREGYHFVIECDDFLCVNADKKRIEQVIYNLISNAINYTGEDKKVEIRAAESTPGIVHVDVIDTGKGIPQDQIATIWDRYYRSKETHIRAKVGTGLGLSIVKTILQAHKARFGINSKLGEGSDFWFELKKAEVAGNLPAGGGTN